MSDPPEVFLTPAEFHILLALAGGEQHGYRIMQNIAADTGGRFRIGPGTLYTSIKRLLQKGFIIESGERPDPALDDKRRRYYRLSDAGRQAASDEAQRLETLVAHARLRRLLPSLETGREP